MLEVSVLFQYNLITFPFIRHAYNYITPAVVFSVTSPACCLFMYSYSKEQKYLILRKMKNNFKHYKLIQNKKALKNCPIRPVSLLCHSLPSYLSLNGLFYLTDLPLLPAITSYFSLPWFHTTLFFNEVA